jgi:hypothetical protein
MELWGRQSGVGLSVMLIIRRVLNLLSQADSLVELLNHLHTVGTIKLTKDPSIQPHGISRIDVVDPEAFRRCTAWHSLNCSQRQYQPLSPALHDPPAVVSQRTAPLVLSRGRQRQRRRARAAGPPT